LGIAFFSLMDTLSSYKNIKLGIEMGRISVDLSDELEKRLRFKTVERFGGKKGDLSRAVEEAVRTYDYGLPVSLSSRFSRTCRIFSHDTC
jgi:hypothetical protein